MSMRLGNGWGKALFQPMAWGKLSRASLCTVSSRLGEENALWRCRCFFPFLPRSPLLSTFFCGPGRNARRIFFERTCGWPFLNIPGPSQDNLDAQEAYESLCNATGLTREGDITLEDRMRDIRRSIVTVVTRYIETRHGLPCGLIQSIWTILTILTYFDWKPWKEWIVRIRKLCESSPFSLLFLLCFGPTHGDGEKSLSPSSSATLHRLFNKAGNPPVNYCITYPRTAKNVIPSNGSTKTYI